LNRLANAAGQHPLATLVIGLLIVLVVLPVVLFPALSGQPQLWKDGRPRHARLGATKRRARR